MIGGAGKKLSTMVDLAEDLYERVNELRTRLEATSETVESTADQVDRMEVELAEQRALLEAVADEQGVDVQRVLDGVGESPDGGTEGGPESADVTTE